MSIHQNTCNLQICDELKCNEKYCKKHSENYTKYGTPLPLVDPKRTRDGKKKYVGYTTILVGNTRRIHIIEVKRVLHPRVKIYKVCSIKNCKNNQQSQKSHGYCKKHYNEYWYYTSTSASSRSQMVGSAEASYKSMIQRCYSKRSRSYAIYGNRGITVCDRWVKGENGLSGYECFIIDMGKRPSRETTLDRIDNNKGYFPENCRWTSRTIQVVNRGIFKNNTTGYTGVQHYKNGYMATLRLNGKYKLRNRFSTLEEAVDARKNAEDIYFKPIMMNEI